MKVFDIHDIKEIQKDNIKRSVALGFFDGVHKGHRRIINKAVDTAKKNRLISCLITFDISPKEFFTEKKIKLLTPKQSKLRILKELGLDEVYILKFNKELSEISREEFIDRVLNKLNIVNACCGEDYLFGSKGLGTPRFIKEYSDGGIEVDVIKLVKSENENKISSTYLRKLVVEGKFLEYKEISGDNYSVSGQVIKGKQLGRTISFPTANLLLNEEYLLPEILGVYLTRVKVKDKYYKGITNIGKNPTVSNEGNLSIETHILNFDKDIYNEILELTFYDFIRKERKFSSLAELKKQLLKDKVSAEMINLNLSIEKK